MIVAGLGLAAAACQRGAATGARGLRNASVILINIDSLRADHLGSYGYSRATSPFIDRLATQGVVFDEAASNSSYTRESVTSLFTGSLPSNAGPTGWDAHPADNIPVLAEVLHQAGYATFFLSNTTMLTNPAFTRGFDEVVHMTEAWGRSRAGSTLSRRAAEVLRGLPRGRPFFMYLHYLDPHGPYDPPPELLAQLGAVTVSQPLDVYADVRAKLPELVKQGFGVDDPRFIDMVWRYDAEILDTDHAIAELYGELERMGLLERLVVVVTADHGEEFLEHGFVEHAWTLYEESVHIPLILWSPGGLMPQRVPQRVSTVDVAPTLLSLLSISGPPAQRDGVSLASVAADGSIAFDVSPDQQLGELLIQERNVVRSVTRNGMKYVAASRWLEPNARPAAASIEDSIRKGTVVPDSQDGGTAPRAELFELRTDRAETRNVAKSRVDEANALEQRLRPLEQKRTHPARRTATLSPADSERMRALGY